MNYFPLENSIYGGVELFAKLGITSQIAAVNQNMWFWTNEVFVFL